MKADGSTSRPSSNPRSAAERFRLLIAADRLSAPELDQFLQREGLSHATLDEWRSYAAATRRLRDKLKAERLRFERIKVAIASIALGSLILVVLLSAVVGSGLGDRLGGPKNRAVAEWDPNPPPYVR